MKNIYLWLCLLAFAGACRGPEGLPGPQGPRGPQGQDGYDGLDGGTAYLFEFNFDLSSIYDYTDFFVFPNDFPTYPDDVILVYRLWGEDDKGNDVWRLLPQSTIMEFGWMQYNYDHTKDDVQIFLEADFPLSKLGPDYTLGWVRIVVIAGLDWLNNGRVANPVDFSDYNAVKEAYGLPELPSPEDASHR